MSIFSSAIKIETEIIDQVIRAPKIWGWKYFHNKIPKKLRLFLVEKFGQKEKEGISKNLIVNTGLPLCAARLGGVSGYNILKYIAIGDGQNTPSENDTALGDELYRVESSNSLITSSITNDTLQLEGTFSIDSSCTIREIGSFNAASGGTMFNRALLQTPRVLGEGDTYFVTIKIKFSRQA